MPKTREYTRRRTTPYNSPVFVRGFDSPFERHVESRLGAGRALKSEEEFASVPRQRLHPVEFAGTLANLK